EVGATQAVFASRPDSDHRRISETVGARRPAELLRSLAIGREHRAGCRQRKQSPNHVAVLGRHPASLGAQPRHPHRWRWLLVRSWPNVDVAVMEELALPIER